MPVVLASNKVTDVDAIARILPVKTTNLAKAFHHTILPLASSHSPNTTFTIVLLIITEVSQCAIAL